MLQRPEKLMTTGVIKVWSERKGFGFLVPDGADDIVFVHHTSLQVEGFKTLREGEIVDFTLNRGPKGPQASNVRPFDSSPRLPGGANVIPLPMAQSDRRLQVFLCHSSADKPTVRQLFDRLAKISYLKPWLDEKCLLPGQDWSFEITHAVREADCVLVCLSHESVAKEGYVQKEIRYALDIADEKPDGTIYLIPVRLEPCKPPKRIERWQYVDLFGNEGYDLLLRSLHMRAVSLGLRVQG